MATLTATTTTAMRSFPRQTPPLQVLLPLLLLLLYLCCRSVDDGLFAFAFFVAPLVVQRQPAAPPTFGFVRLAAAAAAVSVTNSTSSSETKRAHVEDGGISAANPSAEDSATTGETYVLPARGSSSSSSSNNCGYPSPLHSVHVVSLLTDDEARQCLDLAQRYASKTKCWEVPDYERHATYPTCDFPVDECDDLSLYLESVDFDARVFGLLANRYGDLPVDVLNYVDLFCAHYRASSSDENDDDDDDGSNPTAATSTTTKAAKNGGMDRLESHRDGSILSFNVLLTPPDEFEGGGTFFDGFRDEYCCDDDDGATVSSSSLSSPLLQPGGVVRPRRAGDVVLHSGKALHGASPVTRGHRTVLVGFVDVDGYNSRCVRPGTLSKACRDWGRMDVAAARYERQKHQRDKRPEQLALFRSDPDEYRTRRNKWQPDGAIRVPAPAFASVARRADPAYQRRKRLQAEDVLLRDILLPESERKAPIDFFGGDVTVL